MVVKVKRLSEKASMPYYATASSAGCDIRCIDDVTVYSHSAVMIHTGLAFEPDRDDVMMGVYARSGLACKAGCGLANGVGVIDYDYRGELIVCLYNHSSMNKTIFAGDRIAQIVFHPIIRPEFIEVEELSDTERGAGGFGSTGRK